MLGRLCPRPPQPSAAGSADSVGLDGVGDDLASERIPGGGAFERTWFGGALERPCWSCAWVGAGTNVGDAADGPVASGIVIDVLVGGISASSPADDVGESSTRAAVEAVVVWIASRTAFMGAGSAIPNAAGAEASTSMRRNLSAPLAREASVALTCCFGDSKSVVAALEDTPRAVGEGWALVSDCGYGVPTTLLDEAMLTRDTLAHRGESHLGRKIANSKLRADI